MDPRPASKRHSVLLLDTQEVLISASRASSWRSWACAPSHTTALWERSLCTKRPTLQTNALLHPLNQCTRLSNTNTMICSSWFVCLPGSGHFKSHSPTPLVWVWVSLPLSPWNVKDFRGPGHRKWSWLSSHKRGRERERYFVMFPDLSALLTSFAQ